MVAQRESRSARGLSGFVGAGQADCVVAFLRPAPGYSREETIVRGTVVQQRSSPDSGLSRLDAGAPTSAWPPVGSVNEWRACGARTFRYLPVIRPSASSLLVIGTACGSTPWNSPSRAKQASRRTLWRPIRVSPCTSSKQGSSVQRSMCGLPEATDQALDPAMGWVMGCCQSFRAVKASAVNRLGPIIVQNHRSRSVMST